MARLPWPVAPARSGFARFAVAIAVAASAPGRLAAQQPPEKAVHIGLGLGSTGLGAEVGVRFQDRYVLFVRGETIVDESGGWLGGRVDLETEGRARFYLGALVGRYRCYPNDLGGNPTGCPSFPDDEAARPAGVALTGLELFGLGDSRWSGALEAGWRLVDFPDRSGPVASGQLRLRVW